MKRTFFNNMHRIFLFLLFLVATSFERLAHAAFFDFLDEIALSESEVAINLYNFLFPIGIAFGIFGIIMAGYTYMTSEGRPDKVKDANERLTAAILGTIFIVLSLVILRLIINTLF